MHKIKWTDETLNVFVGCSPCSPGCLNCAARTFAKRLVTMGKSGKFSEIALQTFKDYQNCCKWDETVVFRPKEFVKLTHWKKSRLIFLNFMSDTFHENAKDEWRDEVFAYCGTFHQHTFQALTKRANKMYEYFQKRNCPANFRLGISVCNQEEADEKAGYLEETPASFRFVSFEPLLSPVIYNFAGISQAIIGVESINGRVGRLSMHAPNKGEKNILGYESMWIDWAIDLVRQAKEAGVKVFVKQCPLNGKVVKDMKQFPKELQFQER
jgi:protein gp37